MSQNEFPEHEKLQKVKSQSQAIGGFLDWLNEQECSICKLVVIRQNIMREDLFEWYPVCHSITKWLEKYFEIDGMKLDKEKKQMLAQLQEIDQENTE